MNYANMIEEKNLKKGFIVATLISTVVGTFTASMTLHDKIQERREAKKQKATDSKQDDEIKQLREEMKAIENGKRRGSRSSSRSRSRSRSRRRRRLREREEDYYADDDRFVRSAWRSRAMIEQAYEENLRRMGSGYARGDLVTENQLQAQIIQLQQTVINVLQDALYNGRPLTQADIDRLIEAQDLARRGSLNALHDQCDRMNAARRRDDQVMPLERAITAPAPYEPRQLTYTTRQNSLPLAPPKMKALPAPTPHLFCEYAEQLQMTNRALSPAFDPQSDKHCPACGIHIPVDSQDFWTLTVQVPDAAGARRPVDYEFDARLVVKSHLEDGRFACVLCNKLTNTDCLCRDVEALVQHLGKKHTAEDYAIEPDLVRQTRAEFSSNERSRELVLRR